MPSHRNQSTSLAICCASGPAARWQSGFAMLSCVALSACAAQGTRSERTLPEDRLGSQHWERGTTRMQGYVGARIFEDIERRDGSTTVTGSDEELAQVPSLGGGGQWKLGGNRIDYGFEGLFGVNWRANAVAFASTGGGLAVAVDADLLLLDLYGGPFISIPLGQKLRAYGAAGPLLQFAQYDEYNSNTDVNESSSGFGTGWYGRVGLELLIKDGMYVGLVARHTDSSISLSDGMGTLDLNGWEYALTVTKSW